MKALKFAPCLLSIRSKNTAPLFDILKPVLYYPVGGLHGKLTVTAKLAPCHVACLCGVRRHDCALEPGDMSPNPSHRPPAIKPNQTAPHLHPAPRSRLGEVPPELRNPKSVPESPQSRLIVLNQGISRHIKAYQGKREKSDTTIPSANGAAPYQPKATPWVRPPSAQQP